MGLAAPTTRAQVTGHRFLARRLHLGLVFGDTRMIHDPLARRGRAFFFGLVAVALAAAGAGLFAVLEPDPDPGDARILRADTGALYVTVDGVVHPVANLVSARLVTGSAEEPVSAGPSFFEGVRMGVPVGVLDAPGVIADEAPDGWQWAVCQSAGRGGRLTVRAGLPLLPLDGIVLAVGEEAEWLVSSEGRVELPAESTPAGRAIRRRLGIGPDTPRLPARAELLSALRDLGSALPPAGIVELLDTREGAWAVTGVGGVTDGGGMTGLGVAPLGSVAAGVLRDLGVPSRPAERGEVMRYPDAPLHWPLPDEPPRWSDALCAVGPEGLAARPQEFEGVALAEGPADSFVAPLHGAIAVDTGFGVQVVTPYGVRHRVPDPEHARFVGLPDPVPGYWPALGLLPEGSPLDRESALRGGW